MCLPPSIVRAMVGCRRDAVMNATHAGMAFAVGVPLAVLSATIFWPSVYDDPPGSGSPRRRRLPRLDETRSDGGRRSADGGADPGIRTDRSNLDYLEEAVPVPDPRDHP